MASIEYIIAYGNYSNSQNKTSNCKTTQKYTQIPKPSEALFIMFASALVWQWFAGFNATVFRNGCCFSTFNCSRLSRTGNTRCVQSHETNSINAQFQFSMTFLAPRFLHCTIRNALKIILSYTTSTVLS